MYFDSESKIKKISHEMLLSGSVFQVLAWSKESSELYPEPAFFETVNDLEHLTFSKYCAVNLSKYLIKEMDKEGKTLVFMRPCDTFNLNVLLKENQIKREKIYVVGVGCDGVVKVNEGEEVGLIDVCEICTKTEHMIYDELINADQKDRKTTDKSHRFLSVKNIEELSTDEKYDFWQNHLKKCIRCNACRNICPVCFCVDCVFDSTKMDSRQKVNASTFEEQMFHIIRAYHVAGRCTDCGRCQNACPAGIKLNLLNRKFIKEINDMYGKFQAGEDVTTPAPLQSFNIQTDPEPSGKL